VSDVAGDQDALGAKIDPGVRKVGKVNTPILGLLFDMSLEAEAIRPRRPACEIPLVIRPLVFIGNSTVH
jgi:hypothetical protein